MVQTTDVLIIGTGFSGLGMGIQLRKAGREDFIIVEKAGDVGGTWRDNTYPGCECDIPSHMYSFSYELNPEWSKNFSGNQEIWDYLRDVSARHGLDEKIHYGVEVTSAEWDDDRQRWTVLTDGGETYDARAVVSGVGALHIPNIPNLPGTETFQGERFHSSQWDHGVDLRGKRVAVVGTGASAVQFAPIIADQVDSLTVFQRTPPWVLPKNDKTIPQWKRSLFRSVPRAQRAYRNALYWTIESRAIGFNGQVNILKFAEKIVERYIRKAVDDPALQEKLIPQYRMGCKRILQSNTYYRMFNRDHVTLVDSGVAEITTNGVVDNAGVEHEVDVIIYGTGFHVVDALEYLDITGREGKNLGKVFEEDGVETYLGINATGFPNLFFMLGPNTGLGHNSVVFMIEQQAKYIVRFLDELDRRGASAADVRPAAQRQFNDTVQRKLTKGIWTQGGCTSWYLDSQGKNRTIWPGFTFMYWWETRKVQAPDYEWVRAA
ncbi:NAD(P)/FAD-dependent oxidoreductase [Nocardioidaceae bacterium SCSIO 66511]|nr:NAD(P)/FAD-dependent oxidoreductase [Nocardioidaceae bacterium SCSIO 66511]